ncbi:MAG: family 1 glycosylhydrolase [Myxococcota bacterium]
MNAKSFPKGFWWGCATSSHQVEGGNDNDWTQWEQRAGTIADGTTAGEAAGWWAGAAEADLQQAADWGHTATRMSVEWSRLEPSPGTFDDAAFDRYRAMLEHAGRLGLGRLVTLNHFTLPRWVAQRGAWLNPAIADWLGRFSEVCAERLGDVVERWATINEPSLVAMFGYADVRWPPGLGNPLMFGKALTTMMRAHVQMVAGVKRAQADSDVGLILNMPRFDPARDSALDRGLAWLQDYTVSGALLHALRSDRMPPPFAPNARIRGLSESFDWLGLNYYGRYAVKFSAGAARQAFGVHVQPGSIRRGDTDWGQPCPEGMVANLQRLAALGVPLLVTENGVYDNDDARRPAFIRSHIGALQAAVAEGLDVRGYFHWSLVDNFEWAEGWSTRFGLLALDRQTGRRTPRPSAELFASICRNNGLGSM